MVLYCSVIYSYIILLDSKAMNCIIVLCVIEIFQNKSKWWISFSLWVNLFILPSKKLVSFLSIFCFRICHKLFISIFFQHSSKVKLTVYKTEIFRLYVNWNFTYYFSKYIIVNDQCQLIFGFDNFHYKKYIAILRQT